MRLLFAQLAATWPAAGYEASRAHATKLDHDDRSLRAELTRGAVLSHRDWITADRARLLLRQRWSELFAAFDIVVCPVMPTTAFPHVLNALPGALRIDIDGASHEGSDQFAWPGVATLPGLPATSIPLEISEDGLPIGVQCIGPMFEDRTPLHFAELVERERGGFVPPKLA
jgi:amidase